MKKHRRMALRINDQPDGPASLLSELDAQVNREFQSDEPPDVVLVRCSSRRHARG
jgi:hypothetical protein